MAAASELFAVIPQLTIRAMTDADVARVAEIERTAYEFPWSEGIFRDCVRVGYLCRAVCLDERIIGYAVLSMGAGEAHVLNLCVEAAYRYRGIGRHLMKYLIARAAQAGMQDVFLEVRPSNTTAIRLYQSLGFEPIGVRRGYYQALGGREDATVLKLPLRA